MANDEVLAAAEVVKSGAGDYSLKAIIKRELAAIAVAGWAIARLAAEAERERMRAEPVTEERLRAIGFKTYPVNDDGSTASLRLRSFVMRLEENRWWWSVRWSGDGSRNGPFSPATMGQLEDLLSGLGIETKREGGGM